MKQHIQTGLCAALLLFLWGGSMGLAATVNKEDLTKKMEETQLKINRTRVQQYNVMSNLTKTQHQLDKITGNLNQLNSRLGNTQGQINAVTDQLNRAQKELDEIKANINDHKEVLSRRLVTIYKYGYQSYLEALFQAQNFSEFVSRFEMVGKFVQQDAQLLQTLQKQQGMIDQKREEITKKQKELVVQKNAYDRLKNQTVYEQNRYQSTANAQQQELAKIQNDLRLLEESYEEMERTSKDIEAQIRSNQGKNKTVVGSGKYIWPCSGTVTSYFGNRIHPILRRYIYHTGIDIATKYGTPIVASDAGVVIFCAYNGGYGNMVTIDHGNGMSTVYAHCSAFMINLGQVVTKGQMIAKVGSTGLSTGPHVHFEVRKDGVPMNPMSYIN